MTWGDVTRGTPDPQVFLTAAKRMRVSPIHRLVIEDAAAGTLATQASRMATVGLTCSDQSRDQLAAGDLLVDSLKGPSVNILQELV